MPDPLNLALSAVGQARPSLLRGRISTSQPAPTSFASPLHVVIPQWDPDYFWTLTTWPQLHGSSLPAQGAPCLLARDDQRGLWCVAW